MITLPRPTPTSTHRTPELNMPHAGERFISNGFQLDVQEVTTTPFHLGLKI
jgi:hypothetical protein